MAANLSNALSVTEAGIPVVITIAASTATEPSTGGPVTITGTTNEPDGTNFTLNVNGADSGLPAVASAGGTFSFTYTIPANTTTVPVTYTFTAQD
jgi:hypothetical protein